MVRIVKTEKRMIENIEPVQLEFEPARFPFRNPEGLHDRDVETVQRQALAAVAAKVAADELEVHGIPRKAVYGPSAAGARRCVKRRPQRRAVRKARGLACCYARLADYEVCARFRRDISGHKCASRHTGATHQ